MSQPLPAKLAGAHLDQILVEEHVLGGSRTLVSIYLSRADGAGLRLRVAANGWGLTVTNDPPAPVEFGTPGSIIVRSAGLADGIPGGRVAAAWSVRAAQSLAPVGLRWVNDAGDDVVIYGYDDALLVAPPDRLELDNVTFVAE